MDLNLTTEKVKELALSVGQFITDERQNFERSSIEKKGAHDYVSYVDKESERRIVNGLRQILPEAGFLTEEGTCGKNDNGTDLEWVVDPLDGTTNFIHNHAPFNVSIALRQKKDKKLLIGVVYECCRKELFWANAESDAFMNGKKIHVTDVNTLDDSFVILGLPYNAEANKPTILRTMDRLYGNVAGLRIIGSAACEFCYIACGRCEARMEASLKPWDISAGALILMRAGGKVTDFSGGDNWRDGKEVLATNGLIHEQFLSAIKA